MTYLASVLGSGFFFAPFIFVLLYLIIERAVNPTSGIQYLVKAVAALGGLFLIVCALYAPPEFMVLMPGRAGQHANYIPASIFLAIAGAATMALPLYSKFLTFTNRSG